MRNGVTIIEPPVADRWQCFTAPETGVPPTRTPRIGLESSDRDRCPACGHRLADGVIEVSTGITERRTLRKTGTFWSIEHVDPECFGETWYECAACDKRLPEAISQQIAAEI